MFAKLKIIFMDGSLYRIRCLVYFLIIGDPRGDNLNHLMRSKDAGCILMFLSAMPRGVSVAHIYVLLLPLHHL